jgi:hypothetical protein
MVNVTLEAHNVWGDGSGYQLLLDQTATQYGLAIPSSAAPFSTVCNPGATAYDVFSHKIPTDAYPSCNTTTILVNGTITIQIPAGTYDWMIANPDPSADYGGPCIWVVGTNGGPAMAGKRNDYVFEDGYDYHFLMTLINGGNDGDGVIITTEMNGDPCASISNLNANATPGQVVLTWTAATGGPTGYEVRCDNTLLTTTTSTTYTHTNVPEGVHTYSVKALFSGDCIPQTVSTTATVPDGSGCASVIIGTGSAGTYLYPVNMWYRHSYSQQIFDESEIGETGIISAIALEYIKAQGDHKERFSIYLGTTDKTTFDNNSDWVPFSTLTEVFNGTVDFNNSQQWFNIPFNVTDFEYTGGNLVVALLNNHGAYTNGTTDAFRVSPATNKLLTCYVDGTIPINPATPGIGHGISTVTFSRPANRGNIKFKVCPAFASGYNLYRDGELIASELPVTTFTDIDADPYTEHTYCITKICPNGYEALPYSCITLPACSAIDCDEAEIGTGTTTSYQIPLDNYYNFSYVQEIFEASEIGAVTPGRAITSVSFEYSYATPTEGKTFTIYMANIGTQSTFSSTTDWVPLSSMTKVFEGTLPFSNAGKWTTIELDEPFPYIQGQNLVIAINNTTGSYNGTSYVFRVHTTTGNKTIRASKDGVPSYNPAAPPTGTLTTSRNNILFEFCEVPTHDLAATAITGNSQPSALVEYKYTVTVKNNGANAENNFLVKVLTANNEEIETMQVTEPIAAGETKAYDIWLRFETVGEICIKGRVELATDQNWANNATPLLCLNVRPYSIDDVIDIPSDPWVGSTSADIPFDFWYTQSMVQSVYLNTEMGIPGGFIKKLSWFYNNTGSTSKPIKAYLANITENTITGTWLPENIFTEVYSGTANLPVCLYQLTVELPEPYLYTGGSLVIMTERPFHSPYVDGLKAYTTSVSPSGRTRHTHSDSPFTWPTATSTTMNIISNVELVVERTPYGTMSGTITDCETGEPLAGVTVALDKYNITVTTNELGQYVFPFLPAGEEYTVSLTKYLYYDQVAGTYSIAAGDQLVQDFCMGYRDGFIVYGVVQAADGTYIENATLKLEGYADYVTTSGLNGTFEFLGVLWSHDEYKLTVTAEDYQPHTSNWMIQDHLNMGTIILYDVTYKPTSVVADYSVIGDEYADITWGEPIKTTIFRYDSEANDGQIGFQAGTNQSIIGSVHRVGAALISMTWFSTDNAPQAAYNLWILGLNSQGLPDRNQVIYTVNNIPNTPLQWCTYEFPSPVEAPNGFFMGVSPTNGGFTSIGCDLQPNAEWPFVADGNYYSLSAEYAFAPFGNSSIYKNCMIRAEGYTLGKKMTYPVSTSEPVQTPALTYTPSAAPVYTGDPYPQTRSASRGNIGYKLYRLQPGQESTPNTWATLTNGPVNAYEYTDYSWANAPAGTYKWAVQTVYHGMIESAPAFSNNLVKTYKGDFTVNVTTNSGAIPAGAVVTLGTLPPATVAVNQVIFTDVVYGSYPLKVTLAGYEDYTATVAINAPGQSHTATLKEIIKPPFDLATETIDCSVLLTWDHDMTNVMFFNIYVDDVLKAEGVTGTEYLFTGLPVGTYTAGVEAHYASGNSEIVTMPFDVPCLGVSEIENDYNIYPNPTNDYLFVQRANATSASIDVYNAMGMHIATYETTEVNYRINVAALSAGTYFIRVTEGANSTVKSFVKKQ